MTIGATVMSNRNPLTPAFQMRRGKLVRFHGTAFVPRGQVVSISGSQISVRTNVGIVTEHPSFWRMT